MPWYAHTLESFAVTHARPAPPARVDSRRSSRGPDFSPVDTAPVDTAPVNTEVDGVGSVVTTRPYGDMFYEQGLREPATIGIGAVTLLWTQLAAMRLLLRG